MIKMKVISVGERALNAEDGLVILFGKEVSDRLKEVSVIQEFEHIDQFDVKKGMQLMVDDQQYRVAYVGDLVKSNLETVHHTVLDFNAVPDEPRSNAIYLEPQNFPVIHAGSQIIIKE